MDEMVRNAIIWVYLAQAAVLTRGTSDFCSWSGSGSTEDTDPRLVLQVRLRCASGRVRWFSPGQALRVLLEPGHSSSSSSSSSALSTVSICIKPSPSLRGVNVFTERSGRLVLLTKESSRRDDVMCFKTSGAHGPVIYLEASVHSVHSDLSGEEPRRRRTVGFKYEVMSNQRTGASPDHAGLKDPCRPCNNSELLMAICISDFVVRGSIQNISHSSDRETSLIQVSASRVFRQHGSVFVQNPVPHSSSMSWSGQISALLQCHIKPGAGDFLFTGSEHFGRAWLGCAPRFKDFLSVYHSARAARSNPCHFPLD